MQGAILKALIIDYKDIEGLCMLSLADANEMSPVTEKVPKVEIGFEVESNTLIERALKLFTIKALF